jgi:hypothetical protein
VRAHAQQGLLRALAAGGGGGVGACLVVRRRGEQRRGVEPARRIRAGMALGAVRRDQRRGVLCA